MFKFSVPLQKGIELQPYRNYPVPAVRVQVHVDKLVEKQKMQELAEKAQQIIDKNRGAIQHWCNARRQEYSLNTSRADRKAYQLDQLNLTHTIVFDQEYIDIDVYPDAAGKEEDPLCLMIVKGDEIYAIPMDALGSVNSITSLPVVYKKTLQNTNLNNDPDSGLGASFHRQYKFGSSSIGALVSSFRFLPDRIRIDPFAPGDVNIKLYLTPVTDTLEYSYPLDFSGAEAFTFNGDNQVLQFPKGTYTYTATSVTKSNDRTFSPTNIRPYAISADGTCYFYAYAGGIEPYPAHNLLVRASSTDLTAAMATDRQAKYDEYAPLWPLTSPYPSANPLSGTSIQGGMYQGVLPPDELSADVAVDYGFQTYGGSLSGVPDGTSVPLDPAVPAKTDFSQTLFLPVFSTGNGDKIEIKPYTLSGSISISWYAYVVTVAGTKVGLPYRNTTLSVSFNGISYIKTDYRRDYNFGNIGSSSNRPKYELWIDTDVPTLEKPLTRVFRQSWAHTAYVGGTTDVDFIETEVRWSLLPEPVTVSADVGGGVLSHVSNGRHYIQKAAINGVEYVMCNGKDIKSMLDAELITSWNLMVMDVRLSRIKKFT